MNFPISTARMAAATFVFVSALPAVAQSISTLPETLVTATRTLRTVDELMQSVDVLTRQEIEIIAPSSMMELISSVPGVITTRSGGPGKSVGVYLRGANSDHVLVLINGVRASSATLGEYDWNALQPEQIERVEVVRGPLASLYGSDAIGGVIQIFTRGQREGYELSQTIGSNNTRESSIRLSGGDDTTWFLSANTMGTDGTQMRVTDPKRYPSRSANIGLGLNGSLNEEWQYSIGLTHTEGHEKSDLSAGSSDSRNQVIDLGFEGRMSSVWQQKISVYRASNRLISLQGYPPSDIRTDRRQISWINELNFDQGVLTLGMDRMVEDVSNQNPSTASYEFKESLGTTGLFGQFLTSWVGNDLQLGLRRDRHSVFGNANTYSVSLGRHLNEQWRVYASHGTAFKGPTANDFFWPRSEYNDILYGQGNCLVHQYACISISEGNPNLRPERSRTNELGFQFNSDVKYRLNLFETRVTNLIDWSSTESGAGANRTEIWTPSNLGRASMRGAELSASFDWGQWFIQASVNRVLVRNEEKGAPLDRRPDNSATLSALRRFGNHTLRVAFTGASERYERYGTRRLPGYGRVDVVDTIRLSQKWSLRLKVDNLFDKQYVVATSSGVPFATPGREFYMTMRYTH
jgi:vitamin B12 transporter